MNIGVYRRTDIHSLTEDPRAAAIEPAEIERYNEFIGFCLSTFSKTL